jgi:hypothetical protein
MSKGKKTQTSTQTNEPWGPAQPFLKAALNDASTWYNSSYGRDPFPGSTVVPFSPFTTQALGMQANRAMKGSEVQRGANDLLASTLRGDFLNSNPYLDRTFDLAAGKVRGALDTQFNQGGTYGSSMHQGAMAQNLGDLATQIYGGNFEAERARQMQGMLFAPELAQADYNDAQRLAQVGQSYEGQAGKDLQDAMNRYNFYQNAPYARLQQLAGLINPAGQLGGTQTATQPGPKSDTFGQILGTAATIASFFPSASTLKENIQPVDSAQILKDFGNLPSYTYNYKEELGMPGERIGPMAENFAEIFGGDGRVIPMPQLIGALCAAVHALVKKVEVLEEKLKD